MDTTVESTLSELFQQHHHDVYRWAFRLLGNHHDALDVAQDVFIKFSEQCGVVVPGNPRAWLRRVAINRAIDLIRTRKKTAPEDAAQGMVRLASDQSSPEGLDGDELRGVIALAMADLSEQQRLVLVAKVHDGLTFAAIAEDLECSASTAKTHYLRALAAMGDSLGEFGKAKGN